MSNNQPQPEYIDDWVNPEVELQKTQVKKKLFIESCYVDECNYIAPNLQNRQVKTLGEYDPKRKYLTVYPGLNIKGTCEKKDCVAYLKNVWIKKGYGIIDFGEARAGNNCPCCNTKMKPKSFKGLGFRNAKIKFKGSKMIDEEEHPYEKDDQESNGKFVTFKDYDECLCEWVFLKITVEPK